MRTQTEQTLKRTQRIRNTSVLEKLKKETEKTKKLTYLAHIVRHPERYNILHIIIQGKINGQQRTLWLKTLR